MPAAGLSPRPKVIIAKPASPSRPGTPASPARRVVVKSGSPSKQPVLKTVKSMPAVGKSASGPAQGGSDKVVVCVKLKPTSTEEALKAYDISESSGSIALSALHPNVKKRGGKKAGREKENTYAFDAIHQSPTPTQTLYETKIAPLVGKAMQGFNSTVFAYGMTGSGKTHTMSGAPGDIGIIPLAIAGVFDAIEQHTSRQYLLRVSYIEIYNETLRDLLNMSKKPLADSEKPAIHLENGVVVVRPLVEEIVHSPEEVLAFLKKGETNRRVGATDWNERSSRSHCVFTMTIESKEGAQSRMSRLTLIDLAGSEKATVNKERLAEGKFINKSLLSLGMVIEQLADKTKKPGSFIGYRNSKLTHMLENALGGNANIAVICTLSLEEHHQSEALETLKFASRCSQVETQAQQGVVLSSKMLLQAKEEEILALKQQLEGLAQSKSQSSMDAHHGLSEEVEELQSRKDRLLQQLAALNGDILTSKGMSSSDSLFPGPSRMRRRVSEYVAIDGSGSPTKRNHGLAPMQSLSRRVFSGGMPDSASSGGGLEEAFIRSMQEVRVTEKQEVGALRAELSEANRENDRLQEVENQLAELQRRFGDESAKRAELQRLHEVEKERSFGLEIDLKRMKEERDRLQKELDFAEACKAQAASLPRVNGSGLPLPSPEQRPAMISRHTGSLKDYRVKGAAVDPEFAALDRVQAQHQEEVERLEIVIRGMRSTNEALLEKVAEWRERVLEQNGIIQSLVGRLETSAAAAAATPRTPEKKLSDRSLATSSRSNVRERPPFEGSPSQRLFGTPKKHGIGLVPDSKSYGDVFSSPPPLPMTPSMDSNSPRRTHRRVTVEKDMHRLQSSNRVDSARALFSGLESGSERTRVVLPSPRRA